MSLASQMNQLREKLEAAQKGRLGAVRTDLARTMAEHATRVDSDLKGIFSQAAIIRGRADDLIDRFAAERRNNAKKLRDGLGGFVSDLRSSVDDQLDGYGNAREEMSAREGAARVAYVEGLRSRTGAVLANAENYLSALKRDRLEASRIWHEHSRKVSEWNAKARARVPDTVASPEVSPTAEAAKAPSTAEAVKAPAKLGPAKASSKVEAAKTQSKPETTAKGSGKASDTGVGQVEK